MTHPGKDPDQSGSCGICRKCGGVYWGECSCLPYRCAILEWDVTHDWDDGKRIPGSDHLEYNEQWARSEEQAAEEHYRGRDDEPDCEEKHVAVKAPPHGKATIYIVHAEAVIDYHASCRTGFDRLSFEATKIADAVGIEIPDGSRPQNRLPDHYHARVLDEQGESGHTDG